MESSRARSKTQDARKRRAVRMAQTNIPSGATFSPFARNIVFGIGSLCSMVCMG